MQMSVTAEPRSRHFKKKSSRERGNRNMRFFLNIAPNRIATHEKEGGQKNQLICFIITL